MAENHEIPLMKHAMMKAAGEVLAHPAIYRAAISAADSALRHLPRFLVYNPLNTWTTKREMPEAPNETFHSWWKRNRMNGNKGDE